MIPVVLILLMAPACKPQYSNPPPAFQDFDLVGTWEAHYMEWGSDKLIIRADGTFKQIYTDHTAEGYVYETPWSEWWIECFPDGRVRLHLQGARIYKEGIRIAELDGMGSPCPEEFPDCASEHTPRPFYDPIAGESLNMVGELLLNVQRDSSGELVLLHMLLSKDQGFVSLAGTATGFSRVTESSLPTPSVTQSAPQTCQAPTPT